MENDSPQIDPLDLRPTVVLFCGEDTFVARDSYVDLIGKHAPILSVVGLSAEAESEEWMEILQESFQIFTAVRREKFAEARLLANDDLKNVPVLIIVRQTGVDRYSELVRTVVGSAAKQQIADKLEFITITDVSQVEELTVKAARFHNAVSSVDSAVVQLQTGVLAICDYWRGAPIGSDQKLLLAMARIAALITLSQYDLENSHFGYFRNGVLGGKTFWVGLSAYTADRIGECAGLIYAGALRDKIRELLTKNPASIVSELKDVTYQTLLRTVGNRIGGVLPAVDTDDWAQLIILYQTEIAPEILEQVCARIRAESEVLTVLDHLAARIRGKDTAMSASTIPMLIPLLPVAISGNLGVTVLTISGLTAIALAAWKFKQRLPKKKPDGEQDTQDSGKQTVQGDSWNALPTIPKDPILAGVLDDLRRELTAKLGASCDAQEVGFEKHCPEGSLIGEMRYRFSEMLKSDEARSAGKSELEKTPRRLLLLALESGKWRTSAECNELLNAQRDAVRKIAAALRLKFIAWVLNSETQRLLDYSFVQEVLYAPPPPASTAISAFCFVPTTWNIPAWPVASDRCALENSIHILYLVQHSNVNNYERSEPS
jgi:hypothetical protein